MPYCLLLIIFQVSLDLIYLTTKLNILNGFTSILDLSFCINLFGYEYFLGFQISFYTFFFTCTYSIISELDHGLIYLPDYVPLSLHTGIRRCNSGKWSASFGLKVYGGQSMISQSMTEAYLANHMSIRSHSFLATSDRLDTYQLYSQFPLSI